MGILLCILMGLLAEGVSAAAFNKAGTSTAACMCEDGLHGEILQLQTALAELRESLAFALAENTMLHDTVAKQNNTISPRWVILRAPSARMLPGMVGYTGDVKNNSLNKGLKPENLAFLVDS